jgi:hypothetical protein
MAFITALCPVLKTQTFQSLPDEQGVEQGPKLSTDPLDVFARDEAEISRLNIDTERQALAAFTRGTLISIVTGTPQAIDYSYFLLLANIDTQYLLSAIAVYDSTPRIRGNEKSQRTFENTVDGLLPFFEDISIVSISRRMCQRLITISVNTLGLDEVQTTEFQEQLTRKEITCEELYEKLKECLIRTNPDFLTSSSNRAYLLSLRFFLKIYELEKPRQKVEEPETVKRVRRTKN